MIKKAIFFIVLFYAQFVFAADSYIGGIVTVDGVQLTQDTATGYTFVVTDAFGNPYDPAAEDMDGLDGSQWYNITIPIYDEVSQPGGAKEGDTAIIHVYKDSKELKVKSPGNGEFTVPNASETKQIDLEIEISPPKADAGPDQIIEEGTTVTLDGSNSLDNKGVKSYLWEQIIKQRPVVSDPSVTLEDSSLSVTTFVPPRLSKNQTEQIYTFKLTVTDEDGNESSDEVNITVKNNGIRLYDDQPSDLITFKSSTGYKMGIQVSGGTLTALYPRSEDYIKDNANKPKNFIYGLLDFKIKITPLEKASVTIYLPNSPSSTGYKWYKYTSATRWIDFSKEKLKDKDDNGAAFNGDRNQVTLTIRDNSSYDDDATEGIIRDPSGLGISSGVVIDSSGITSGCFINSLGNLDLNTLYSKILAFFTSIF
ncbi:MAG: hypothetical protein HQK78_17370 [Desulfobacterales bacterium]|nr:hypothetical protein [Desulfobacterales bacterium]